MPNEQDYSHREIERLTKAVDKLTDTIIRLEQRMAETYVRKDVYLEARKSDEDAALVLAEKVNRVSSVIDWAGKLIVGAVLLALLGLVLYSNGGSKP